MLQHTILRLGDIVSVKAMLCDIMGLYIMLLRLLETKVPCVAKGSALSLSATLDTYNPRSGATIPLDNIPYPTFNVGALPTVCRPAVNIDPFMHCMRGKCRINQSINQSIIIK